MPGPSASLISNGGRDNRTDHGLFFSGGTNDYVQLPAGYDDFTHETGLGFCEKS